MLNSKCVKYHRRNTQSIEVVYQDKDETIESENR